MSILRSLPIGIVAFRYFELGQYLTFGYIKASQELFHALYLSHRFLVIAGYMGIHILVTALSLPGAAVLTLGAGGLFGLTVYFASSMVPPWPAWFPAFSCGNGFRRNLEINSG